MRKTLFIHLLIASLALQSCSDASSSFVSDSAGPDAPINEPDQGIFNPTGPVAGGEEPVAGGTGGSGTEEGGVVVEEPGAGSQPGNSGGGSGEGPNPGQEGGGANGGQPVPEPGTLLLFGTGLAGIGASLLRRRRRETEQLAAE